MNGLLVFDNEAGHLAFHRKWVNDFGLSNASESKDVLYLTTALWTLYIHSDFVISSHVRIHVLSFCFVCDK